MPDLRTYTLKLEWWFSWYPIKAGSPIDVAQVHANSQRYRNTEGFEATSLGDHGTTILLPVESHFVAGWIKIETDEDDIFFVTWKVQLGGRERTERIYAPPRARIPFMIDLIGDDADPSVAGTALSLHGTITTGSQAIDFFERLPGKFKPRDFEKFPPFFK
jgi:hypothetical protein